MYDLSILIPSRNELFVSNTVVDILKNKRGKTEIIVGLDGEWANPGIPDHPDVKIVYVSESRGQRAMTNLLCRLSKSKYVAKCDAHTAYDEGFDIKLMKAMERHDDWTIVPMMLNLHAFDWICKNGHRRYQGPSGNCEECGEITSREIVFKPRERTPHSSAFCFDNTLHFQYHNEFKKRPEGQGKLTDTMSLQGSFFMLTRDKYWELNICDEKTGSWGQQGVEVSMKTWLSGGRVVCLQTTWYAHLFRTQGGDFGFPYPMSGRQQEKAREYSRNVWFNNKFDKQIYPLWWVIEKFAPVPGWDKETLLRVRNAAKIFYSTHPLTHGTNFLDGSPSPLDNSSVIHGMPSSTSSLSSSSGVLGVNNQSNMSRITASPITTDNMVEFKCSSDRQWGNKPSVNESMNPVSLAISSTIEESSVSGMIQGTSPVPAPSGRVNADIGEKPVNGSKIEGINDEKFGHGSILPYVTAYSKGIIYYTDNQLPIKLAHFVQKQIKASGLPIVSSSLKPMDKMGKNIYFPLKRGILTYFKQIVSALEASKSDIIFFCEHDVLYHQSHFEFTPPAKDKFYYNLNVWRVRQPDGFAVTWEANQVAELCCYKELALKWYKNKLEEVESGKFNKSYEPGGRISGLYETWKSPFPNIDIRHKHNLTKSKWSPDDFRDKSTCINWQETTIDKIRGWDNLQSIIIRS